MCLMTGKINVRLSTHDLLHGLERMCPVGSWNMFFFWEMPATTAESLPTRTEIRIWEKLGGNNKLNLFLE